MRDERFEWDVAKSEANLLKHGIDFEEAIALWSDLWRVDEALWFAGERRYKLYARYAGAVWIAIFARRGTIIRIISVRRATKKEVSHYGRANNQRS